MKVNFLLCIFLLVLLAILAKRQNSQKRKFKKWKSEYLANSTSATIIDNPFVVCIVRIYERYSSCFCGGAIISKDFVVTAAHCIQDEFVRRGMLSGKVVLRAGSTNIRGSTGYDHRIYGYAIHIDYDPVQRRNDIALIKVKDQFVNDYEQPIEYATTEANHSSDLGFVLGWGLSDSYGSVAERLQKNVLRIGSCKNTIWDEEQWVCGTTVNVLNCDRNIGQPVVHKTLLIGMVSWGRSPCSHIVPMKISKISYFSEWISKTMQYNISSID